MACKTAGKSKLVNSRQTHHSYERHRGFNGRIVTLKTGFLFSPVDP